MKETKTKISRAEMERRKSLARHLYLSGNR